MHLLNGGVRTETVMRLVPNVIEETHETSPEELEESLKLIDELKFFLATAPVNWQENQVIRRFYLNNDQGFASCVLWNNLFYITGTDIVKCCIYRMQKFGRDIIQKKKFEEGIFSDLRHLKCGIDATLEQPKSEFLSFLFRNMCLKTQKKQKVFFWFSVPHDKLFADALERDLKKESLAQPSTTKQASEPALSFQYDATSNKPLYDQLLVHVNSTRANQENYKDIQYSPNLVHDSPLVSQSQASMIENDTDIKFENSQDTEAARQPIDSPYLNSSQNANFSQQILTIVPEDLDIQASQVTFVDPKSEIGDKLIADEDDDFPLDYVPIEIEHPTQDEILDGFTGPQFDMFQGANMPYDSMMTFPEDEVVAMSIPNTSTQNKFTFPMPTPFGWPVSATRPHFMMNGDFYVSNGKNGSESSSPTKKGNSQKNSSNIDLKNTDTKNIDNETNYEEETKKQEEDQPAYPMYPNMYPYQIPYNNNMPPGNFPPNIYGGYQQEQYGPNFENQPYDYDEYMSQSEVFDDNYFVQPDPYGWGFAPSQGMQPNPSFMAKMYSQQNFKQGQVPPRGAYGLSQNPLWNGQPNSNPYNSRNNSKSFQGGPPRQQQAAQSERWRHFHSTPQHYSAKKFFYAKAGKVAKQTGRKQSFQTRQYKMKQGFKSKQDTSVDSSDNNEDVRKSIPSILTPESSNLMRQTESSGDIEYTNTDNGVSPKDDNTN